MNIALSTIEQIGTPRVLVVGDVMLDRYVWGIARRLTPEAPVPVLRSDRQEDRLGGAGAVAYLLRGLEAQVTVCGIVGDDADGRAIRSLFDESVVDHSLVFEDAGRPTTTKERIIGRLNNRCPHQIARVDREATRPLSGELASRLLAALKERLADYEAVLISDYRKGTCSRRLLASVISAAAKCGVPTLVDPGRGADYARYREASLIKPNRLEAQIASGVTIRRSSDALTVGRLLCQQSHAENVLITLDAEGMALVPAGGKGELIAARPRVVHDATGAGDMVLAMLGVCRAAGVGLRHSALLANIAAGLEVERIGVAQISRDDIRAVLGVKPRGRKVVSLDELLSRLEACRRDSQRIVFCNGCFDLLHVGHIRCLEEAAGLGEVLVVAINSDESVQRLKGGDRPLIGAEQRAEMLAALACVDFVVVFDHPTPHELLRAIKPDVVVKGGTYSADGVIGREVVEQYGGAVHIAAITSGVSTTQLAAKLNAVHHGGELPESPVATTLRGGKPVNGEQNIADGRPPSPPRGAGATVACVHLGRRIGFRNCETCKGSVRQKVFACNHPNHSETTLADCKKCPDYAARSHPAEPGVQQAPAAMTGTAADNNGETATGGKATTIAGVPGNDDDHNHAALTASPHAAVADQVAGFAATDRMRAPRYANRLPADAGFVAIGPQSVGRTGRPTKAAQRAATTSDQLILQSLQSPGDIVMLTAAVRDLHLAYPGRFQTDVRTSVPALWENNPYITPLNAAAPGVKTIEMHYDLINQCNTLPYHFVHGYIQHLERQLGVNIPVTRFHGDIHLTDDEKQWMSQVEELGFGGDFWIVMAGGKYDFTAKWWNPACFQKVVDHFRGRIQFVQCGEDGHFHPPLGGAINLVGKTDVRQFVRLMYHAVGVLCPITFAMHLAAAVESKPGRPSHRACVVVAGGREPPHWEAYPHHQYMSTVGSLPCCEHGGCWRSRCQPVGDGDAKDSSLCERPVQVSPELQIPMCMEMVTPEDVIRRIELYYEGKSLAYLGEAAGG